MIAPRINPPIRIVGNLLTDLIISGVERLPDWGREVAGDAHAFIPSGQATYLAQGLRALEIETEVVGAVGDDAAGREILSSLRDSGVRVERIASVNRRQTAISVAVVRPDGERSFISDFACLSEIDEKFLKERIPLDGRPLCVVGLLNLPNLGRAVVTEILAAARDSGSFTVLDTGWDPGDWRPETAAAVLEMLSEVDLFLPNLAEASALTGEKSPKNAVRALAARCQGQVVVKLGSDGCITEIDGETRAAKAFGVKPVDTVGAGDSFNAALIHGLHSGVSLDEAMRWANAAAAIYVSRSRDRHANISEIRLLSGSALDGDSERASEATIR